LSAAIRIEIRSTSSRQPVFFSTIARGGAVGTGVRGNHHRCTREPRIAPGCTNDQQIAFYHNLGNRGMQFLSVGGLVYPKAKAAGVGRAFPTEWFLQDIRD
jgi:hypothetical protein